MAALAWRLFAATDLWAHCLSDAEDGCAAGNWVGSLDGEWNGWDWGAVGGMRQTRFSLPRRVVRFTFSNNVLMEWGRESEGAF